MFVASRSRLTVNRGTATCFSGEVHYLLLGGVTLLLVTAFATPARAEARKFTISDVLCKYLACQARDVQQGFTGLEVEGEDFKEWAGSNLTFRVYRLLDHDRGDIVIDTKVDVSTSGHFVTNVPVYDLLDGSYYLAFYASDAPGKPIAMGIFKRSTVERPPIASSAQPDRSSNKKGK